MVVETVAAPFAVLIAPAATGVLVLAALLTPTLQAELGKRGSASRRSPTSH
jgi:hypothetical protein